ncbi:resistance to inhibitors of cholinesterase protein 3 isoform X2 [Drosophila nasuta]|uniref:resistance to inhibitors of cholinesterase protein 3 isoform X2 n=1 Tax=Drosophila nasuta TaxID=42062 RepID=UPI00295E2CBA|nr:resistance to inhibitors of cholinesterase protein 3 isoform X2 [Drosophila nasuta]
MPSTSTQQKPGAGSKLKSRPGNEESMSPRKMGIIAIVTVVGCIAILWPKVFHPMMFGGTPPKPIYKDPQQRAGPGGCCDVVLDREEFMNASKPATEPFGPHLYRKQVNLYTGEISLRQERPAHLHPESIYQAMRERGRAIPATPTVPIVERKTSPSNPPPRIVDGRPGPIPGMRPPMGAGALHQPQQRGGSSMGFLMPLYTIGIVVFFGYTIMKIVFKKQVPNAPYGPAPSDPSFRQEVFGQQNHSQVEDLGGTKLGSVASNGRRNDKELYNATMSAAELATNLSSTLKAHQQQCHAAHQQSQTQSQAETSASAIPAVPKTLAEVEKTLFNKETEQLMEIEKLRKKLEDTEREMAKLIAEMNTDQYEAKQHDNENTNLTNVENQNISNGHTITDQDQEKDKDKAKAQPRKRRDISAEREVTVLGMELTASCEGGQRWTGRPPTPVYRAYSEHSNKLEENLPEPQSIYLEGALAHDSQILVADSQTKREEVYDSELNGSEEEPAVILSSKMTLSLINLDANQQNGSENKQEIESPLADDIEIIGHDEH